MPFCASRAPWGPHRRGSVRPLILLLWRYLFDQKDRPLAAGPPDPQPEPQRHPPGGRLLRPDHPGRHAAAHAARGLPGRAERRSVYGAVYRHVVLLRHGSDPGGYLDAVVPVRTSGHSLHDPAGRPGVYDGHHPVFLCAAPAHRPVRAAHHGLHPEPERPGRGRADGAPRPDGDLPAGGGGRGAAVHPDGAGLWPAAGRLACGVSRGLRVLQRGV